MDAVLRQVQPLLQTAFGGRVVGSVAAVFVVGFFARLVQVRTRFRRLIREYGITETLPHSFLFGHLIPMGIVMSKYPMDVSKLATPYLIARDYPELEKWGIFYFDPWPFGFNTVAIYHPSLMTQVSNNINPPKHEMVHAELGPMTYLRDLITMEGVEWKFWRSTFSPGFSAKNLVALLPQFLEEIEVLKQRLIKAAEAGETVRLEPIIQRGTVDIICRATLGARLHSQTRNTPFVDILINTIAWLYNDLSVTSLMKIVNPYRIVKLWYNNRYMKSFLTPHVERAVLDYSKGDMSGPKTINYLAVKSYVEDSKKQAVSANASQVDPEFMEIAIAQLKAFIFAGHDTTASTLSFAYSFIYREPAVLAKLRAEHDAVLGPDPKDALANLSANPNLLNQLPYTSAVLKETLRLYPPAATARSAKPGSMITHPDTGKKYPIDGWLIFLASWCSQRMEAYWDRPSEFLPERWLAREGEPLYPMRNAWRPFELGPRNCIGQELAQVEMRAILTMTVRDLDFEEAYPADAPSVLGDKVYQTMTDAEITGHIKDGFPVKIKVRKHS